MKPATDSPSFNSSSKRHISNPSLSTEPDEKKSRNSPNQTNRYGILFQRIEEFVTLPVHNSKTNDHPVLPATNQNQK